HLIGGPAAGGMRIENVGFRRHAVDQGPACGRGGRRAERPRPGEPRRQRETDETAFRGYHTHGYTLPQLTRAPLVAGPSHRDDAVKHEIEAKMASIARCGCRKTACPSLGQR